MKTKILFSAALIVLAPSVVFAQSASTPTVITGTDNTGFPITSPVGTGSNGSVPMPVSATFTPSGTQNVTGTGTAGTPATGVVTIQGISGGTNLPVSQATAANLNATVVGTGTFAVQAAISPAARTPVTLDVKTVTTGGTAVNALSAGHATAGGFLYTDVSAGAEMCVNQLGTATTTNGGNTICVPAGTKYNIIPSSGAVSVNSTASSFAISGYGEQ